MASVSLSLLGGFALQRNSGAPVSLPSRKGQALLAYVALHSPRLVDRDTLADLLWTDSDPDKARTNLRQTLTRIRQALNDEHGVLATEGQAIRLGDRVGCDVLEFKDSIADGSAEALARAAALYRGSLLDGFTVDVPPFEEWLLIERESLRELALSGLWQLAKRQEHESRDHQAIATAARILTIDPLNEEIHRLLMRLHAGDGNKGAALRQFDQCKRLLQAELGIAPDSETKRLYEAIRHGGIGKNAGREANVRSVVDKALGYLQDAAERAARNHAHGEAVRLREQLLDLIDELPRTHETSSAEIDICFGLRSDLFALGEQDRVLSYLERAERRCRAISDEHRLAQVYYYQTHVLRILGRHGDAAKRGRRALALAQNIEDGELTALVNLRLAAVHFSTGQYRRAIPLLEANAAALTGEHLRDGYGVEPTYPAILTRSWLAWCHAELGQFDAATDNGLRGIALADALEDRYGRIHARIATGVAHLRAGSLAQAITILEDALLLCQQSDIPVLLPWASVALALAYAKNGETKRALAIVSEAESKAPLDGTTDPPTIFLTSIGEIQHIAGRVQAAHSYCARALSLATDDGERGNEAWTRLVSGEMALITDVDSAAATSDLQAAAEIARELGMRPVLKRCRAALQSLDGNRR